RRKTRCRHTRPALRIGHVVAVRFRLEIRLARKRRSARTFVELGRAGSEARRSELPHDHSIPFVTLPDVDILAGFDARPKLSVGRDIGGAGNAPRISTAGNHRSHEPHEPPHEIDLPSTAMTRYERVLEIAKQIEAAVG